MFASEVSDKPTALGVRDARTADIAVTDAEKAAVISDSSGEFCLVLHRVRGILL
jgi:hypothetical protein